MADHRYGARRDLWVPLAVAAGYYLGAKLGFALTLQPSPVSILWPPNALLLAGLLLTAPRLWPRILAATLVVHVVGQIEAAVPLRMSLCWFVSNCTEALLGAALLRRLGGPRPTFDRFRYVVVFVLCAAVVAPFLSSFLDAAFVRLNGWGHAGYWIDWRTRFFSNMLSTLTLVPVVVIVATERQQLRRVAPARWIEVGLGMAVLLATSLAAFDARRADIGTSPVLIYAVMPLRLIAALRFGPIGAGVSSLVCALMAITGAVAGRGPFVGSSPLDNALSIQLFLIVTHVSLMLLAAVMTERVRAEEMAQINERQLEMALSAARLIPWEWHVKSDLALGSPALWEMLGIPEPATESSQRFIEGVHPDDRPVVRAALAEAMEGRPFDIEFRVVHRDGGVHWLLARGTTRFDVSGAADTIIGVLVDITARKEAEAEIHEQRRAVAHLGRVAIAGELSIALAHELRQPLAAILANARAGQRLLAQDPPNVGQMRDILGDIAADDVRAADVITRLRALMRNDAVSREPLDVNTVVREALLIARPDIAARQVSLETRFEADLPPIAADRIQLQQVLLNLVINGCEAMESAQADGRRLAVSTAGAPGGGVDITVTDAGPGIPLDRLEQIFEPFVTTKPQGLGLGLAICRSIVTVHGGRLHAFNPAEGGASFRLSLPSRQVRART